MNENPHPCQLFQVYNHQIFLNFLIFFANTKSIFINHLKLQGIKKLSITDIPKPFFPIMPSFKMFSYFNIFKILQYFKKIFSVRVEIRSIFDSKK